MRKYKYTPNIKGKRNLDEYVNDAFEQHRRLIITQLSSANPAKPITEEHAKRVFKNSVNTQLNKLYGRDHKLNKTTITKAINKELHSETYTGKTIIDAENVISTLKKSGDWEEFRNLNRKQKIDLNNFKRVKIDEKSTGIRNMWEYTKTYKAGVFQTIIIIQRYDQITGEAYFELREA